MQHPFFKALLCVWSFNSCDSHHQGGLGGRVSLGSHIPVTNNHVEGSQGGNRGRNHGGMVLAGFLFMDAILI